MESKSMLLIGNTPNDVKFIIKTFGSAGDENSLSVVDSCVQGRAFLEKTGKYKEAPRPDVVFVGAHIKKEDREKFMQYEHRVIKELAQESQNP